MIKQKYGVVYTPDSFAQFVAELLKRTTEKCNQQVNTVLDPASGECALLGAAREKYGTDCAYIGIDVDREAVNATKDSFTIFHNDTILPQNVKRKAFEYWKEKLPEIDAIIANPPWSSQKIYDRSELIAAGYTLASGQYDSYVLFLELAVNLLRDNGVLAFIIPDSLFDSQNEKLRKLLVEKTQIKVIARLGEKLFDEVNRAATVIICQKAAPTSDSETICFRLSTDDRKAYLSGKGTLISFFDEKYHIVKQARFLKNNGFNFDVDTHTDEEQLLKKITSDIISWENTFLFGRGVEISKTGKSVCCPHCGCTQGYKKKQLEIGKKKCICCYADVPVSAATIQNLITQTPSEGSVPVFVGENIRRYLTTGECYIKPNIEGINYKNQELYAPPKLLIRKTGLGIYCAIDYTGSMTSQTVYILKYANGSCQTPLEYYLALLNSRVVYYFYLKTYGENEWKSHPYLTKQIIYTLPIKPFIGDQNDMEIVSLATKLMRQYDYSTDITLEHLIMRKYGLSKDEQELVIQEMNSLPDLGAINDMKMEV